jgi:hypothetical protein
MYVYRKYYAFQALKVDKGERLVLAGHQDKSINVEDTKTSFMVLHQNIRGLLNKSEKF